jgi:hypothetical protein
MEKKSQKKPSNRDRRAPEGAYWESTGPRGTHRVPWVTAGAGRARGLPALGVELRRTDARPQRPQEYILTYTFDLVVMGKDEASALDAAETFVQKVEAKAHATPASKVLEIGFNYDNNIRLREE